jgi:hypothetical protein
MRRKAWLLLAVVPVFLVVYVVNRSLIPAPAGGGQTDASRSTVASVPGAAVPEEQPAVIGLSFMDLDPFALLDKKYETQRTAETARFDETQAGIRARIQPALDACDAKYRRDMEALDRRNLTADQKGQWSRELSRQYEKARLGIKRTIQSDLEELAAKRKEALAKQEADRAAKQARLQEIQALAENGQITPRAAKRSQFEVLGISLPPDTSQSPEAAEERRGPTGTEGTAPKDSAPSVEAVIAVADNRFCALIGDALVSEGDMVQGCRVRKIQADSVEFEKDGKTWVQRVN